METKRSTKEITVKNVSRQWDSSLCSRKEVAKKSFQVGGGGGGEECTVLGLRLMGKKKWGNISVCYSNEMIN